MKLTPAMEQARGAGLKALKPTARELERGLKLHAESLVFDAYGFAPWAALDHEALRQALDAGASDAELQELREEMGMVRCAADPGERAEFETAWRAAGVTCIFQNAGEEGQDPLRLLARLARFTYVTDALRTFVSRAAPGRHRSCQEGREAVPVPCWRRSKSVARGGWNGGVNVWRATGPSGRRR